MRYRAECHECGFSMTFNTSEIADEAAENHTQTTGHRTSYQGIDGDE